MSSWSPRRSDLSASYIESFHRDHAGITERILRRARSADTDSYEWLVAAVHSRAFVLDIGSGSGPVAARVQYWIGIDRSPEELAVAKLAGRPTVVRATADALPARSAAVVVAVSAMSLQVLEPIDDVMAELARVMRPGGQLAVLRVPRTAATGRQAVHRLAGRRRRRPVPSMAWW
jgi:SAM-dependent methyltransferase